MIKVLTASETGSGAHLYTDRAPETPQARLVKHPQCETEPHMLHILSQRMKADPLIIPLAQPGRAGFRLKPAQNRYAVPTAEDSGTMPSKNRMTIGSSH